MVLARVKGLFKNFSKTSLAESTPQESSNSQTDSTNWSLILVFLVVGGGIFLFLRFGWGIRNFFRRNWQIANKIKVPWALRFRRKRAEIWLYKKTSREMEILAQDSKNYPLLRKWYDTHDRLRFGRKRPESFKKGIAELDSLWPRVKKEVQQKPL